MTLIDHPFSIRHLPYGIVRFGARPQLCVRLDDQAISLESLEQAGLLKPCSLGPEVTRAVSLNPLLALPRAQHVALRARLIEVLGRSDHRSVPGCCQTLAPYPLDDESTLNPLKPTDFVDFYCSRHHAFRVGCLFRGVENALPEQYFDLPIGYHGRSSTVYRSGTPVVRPSGVLAGPRYAPSERLDYELEVGFVLRGHQGYLPPAKAFELLFGVVLLNDWSARDIQSYEYRPLGPFLGKSFATTIGAWVTPLEALSDLRQSSTDSDHPVLPHLDEKEGEFHFDLPLSATFMSQKGDSLEICSSNLRFLAWSAAQMVTHLSSNGSVISPGDLIATGTVSGPETGAEGCLLERTQGGKVPLEVGRETRTYLLDGDSVTLLGGVSGVGLAPCRGEIVGSPTENSIL